MTGVVPAGVAPGGSASGGVVLAEVVRSGFVEGVHRGSVVVLDAHGGQRDAAGDVTGPIFPRSSSKPLQAVGMLRVGLRPPAPVDLALICGSHLGEPFHTDGVRALLLSAGLDAAALRCPADLPLDPAARDAVLRAGGGPSPLTMNCSGKHAGMLLTCLTSGWPLESYLAADHPVQVAVAAAVADLAGEPIAATGVDGCGAPVLAFSLTALARAFLRLVDAAPGSHERAVADAMRAHPLMVAGTGAEDTVLMAGLPGLISKVGAEGVMAVAVPGVGAVALKIDDGAARARTPVLVSALRRLGVEAPASLATVPLLGGGVPVGAVRAVW
jgi:L-asparaginase II